MPWRIPRFDQRSCAFATCAQSRRVEMMCVKHIATNTQGAALTQALRRIQQLYIYIHTHTPQQPPLKLIPTTSQPARPSTLKPEASLPLSAGPAASGLTVQKQLQSSTLPKVLTWSLIEGLYSHGRWSVKGPFSLLCKFRACWAGAGACCRLMGLGPGLLSWLRSRDCRKRWASLIFRGCSGHNW